MRRENSFDRPFRQRRSAERTCRSMRRPPSVRRQRRLPLPRPGLRRAAVRARRRARRGVAADRRGGARLRALAAAVARCCATATCSPGARAGADELLLLPRDRPAAAGDRRRDRVPARDRARRARRAHAAATSRRSRWPCRASTCSPACTSRASRSASRWRSPTPGLFAAYIVLAHRVASPRRGRRRTGGGDARRARVRHADGGLGRGARVRATRSRSRPGIGVGISSLGDPVRRRPGRDEAAHAAPPTR